METRRNQIITLYKLLDAAPTSVPRISTVLQPSADVATSSWTDESGASAQASQSDDSSFRDMRYQALLTHIVAHRSSTPLLDSIDAVAPLSTSVKDTEVSFTSTRSSGSVTSPAISVGDALLKTFTEQMAEAKREQGKLYMAYTAADIEEAFLGYEATMMVQQQTLVGLMNIVFMVCILVAEGIDQGGFHHGTNGLVLGLVSISVSAAWIAVLRTRFSVLVCRRWAAATYNVVSAALAFATVWVFPFSIVNTTYVYVMCFVSSFVIFAGGGWLHSIPVLALSAVATILLSSGRKDTDIVQSLVSPLAVLVGALLLTYRSEASFRATFENVCLSNALLRRCEDEYSIQQKMYELLLPPFLVKEIMNEPVGRPSLQQTDPLYVRQRGQLCVVAIRVEGLSALVTEQMGVSLNALALAESATFKIDEILRAAVAAACPAEHAASAGEVLCKVSVLGDEVMMAGPFSNEGMESESILSMSARCTMNVLVQLASEPLRLSKKSIVDGEEVFENRSLLFTAVATCDDAILSLLASECLSLVLVGVAARRAHALVNAAPAGFVGCTPSFKTFIDNHHPNLGLGFCSADQWRVRGVGSVNMLRLSPKSPHILRSPAAN